MKTHVLASAMMLGSALMALAQQVGQTPESRPANQVNPNRNPVSAQRTDASAGRNLSKLDDKTSGATIRASQLNGANIKNSNGDNVGEIKDLVIDASGRVRYVAVTYGGFLGLGSKLFAVPFEAFRVSRDPDDPNDPNDYVLTLDVTKEQLDGAEGFDNDHWPNFADTKMTQDLDRRYKVDRSRTRDRGDVNVNVRTGQAPDQLRDR